MDVNNCKQDVPELLAAVLHFCTITRLQCCNFGHFLEQEFNAASHTNLILTLKMKILHIQSSLENKVKAITLF